MKAAYDRIWGLWCSLSSRSEPDWLVECLDALAYLHTTRILSVCFPIGPRPSAQLPIIGLWLPGALLLGVLVPKKPGKRPNTDPHAPQCSFPPIARLLKVSPLKAAAEGVHTSVGVRRGSILADRSRAPRRFFGRGSSPSTFGIGSMLGWWRFGSSVRPTFR